VGQDNRYELRWFTPRCEVKLCGHATLAAGFLVNFLHSELEQVEFQTRYSGTLMVRKTKHMFETDFPAFAGSGQASLKQNLQQALGGITLPEETIVVNETYIAVYTEERAILGVRPDFAKLEALHPFAVAVTAPGQHSDIVSRYFAPSYGLPEDPVTGSLHCALTPYWTKRLGKPKLHARQLSERGGELWCEMSGDRVILRGQAVLTLQGELSV
jgi:PhzF family phenazine biosynthesis protein